MYDTIFDFRKYFRGGLFIHFKTFRAEALFHTRREERCVRADGFDLPPGKFCSNENFRPIGWNFPAGRLQKSLLSDDNVRTNFFYRVVDKIIPAGRSNPSTGKEISHPT